MPLPHPSEHWPSKTPKFTKFLIFSLKLKQSKIQICYHTLIAEVTITRIHISKVVRMLPEKQRTREFDLAELSQAQIFQQIITSSAIPFPVSYVILAAKTESERKIKTERENYRVNSPSSLLCDDPVQPILASTRVVSRDRSGRRRRRSSFSFVKTQSQKGGLTRPDPSSGESRCGFFPVKREL